MFDRQKPSDKKIFIYKLNSPSHNSLLHLVDLDESFENYSLSLSSEIIRGFDTVIIYLFYDGRKYQFIEYQKENSIVPKERTNNIMIDPNDEESFQPFNAPFDIYPLKSHPSQTVNESHPISIFSRNIGLIVKHRDNNGVLNRIHDSFPVTLSLLDHFDGFNLSYRMAEISGGTDDFSFALSGDNIENYLLDAVNAVQEVLYSFQYLLNDVPHLVVIYTKDYLMEIFRLSNGIEKIEENYTYNKYFGDDIIVFASYECVDKNISFLVLSTLRDTNYIGQKYPIKLFSFEILENYQLRTHLLMERPHNMRLLRTLISTSILQSVDYVFIFQSDYRFISDSEITFLNLECPEMEYCTQKDEHSISGTFLQFDNFVVNTFTILGEESSFVAIGVDGFGFIVMDLINGNIIEEIPFYEAYPHAQRFSILKLVNIADNGLRVLMKDGNAFSFIWDNLRRVGDGSIFENARVSTSFLDISGDYSSHLVEEIAGVGVAQLVYYRQSNGFISAFVRLYNFFNRVNSKVYQEFSLGTVRECETLSVINVDKGISLTCGPNLILLRISIYPFLQINATNAAPLTLEIDIRNQFSNTRLIVNARNNSIGSNIPAWLLFLMFM